MRLHTEGTTSIDVAIHIETAGGLIRVHDLVAALVVPDLDLVAALVRVHDLVAALVVPDLVHVAAPVADFAVTFLISSRSVFYFIF
jgi:hypothetical protein